MKNTYSGWYSRSPDELGALWDRAVFVPDTNILLHCLRHSSDVREELLRIPEILKESLWIPYQVGLEFHRHRLEVEGSALDVYDRLVKDYETILGQTREKLRQLRAHPSISVEREVSALEMFLSDFCKRMEQARAQHPSSALALALTRITSIFDGRVGAKPTQERLTAIRKEGEDRYTKRIPPGYKDNKKDGADSDRFGDLIIWKDLIDKAKSEKRPIIFVSDDVKEDWWHIHRGRKLGPRPELLEEFRATSGEDFHIYELGQFLRIAAERHTEIVRDVVAQIEKSVHDDEQARALGQEAGLRARVMTLENERDSLIAALAGVPGADPLHFKEGADKATMRARLAEVDSELASARSKLETKPNEDA